ncbi:MAG TPA: OmpA family protein [Bryobacteraceae bacterium]|nr:OmpA family protein [Bryobacteraceae bacterium]
MRERGTPRWPFVLIALAILAGVFSWLATRGAHRRTAYLPPNPPAATQPAPNQTAPSQTAGTQPAPNQPVPIQPGPNPSTGSASRELPGNVNLHIPPGGVGDRLLRFIEDPSKPVDNTTWFQFDRLRFDTNSTTLAPNSQEQLGNVAAIMKAYPKVHVKIGGYTDNTGNPAANLNLSQQRADTVRQQLIN